MGIMIEEAGLQTTVQGEPRRGLRHFGVAFSGPADPLSMALANRLVQAPGGQSGLEVTLSSVRLRFLQPVYFGLAGADAEANLSGQAVPMHETRYAEPNQVLEVAPPRRGSRVYISFSDELDVPSFLGSTSTYIPGAFGGVHGRSLANGDYLRFRTSPSKKVFNHTSTPLSLRPVFNHNYFLQAVLGPDFSYLSSADQARIWHTQWPVSQRLNRMGIELEGPPLAPAGSRTSSGVFPGTVQCPPSGQLYVLGADAQTTGGYPHVLQVIRCERFRLGQVRPGDRIQFVSRTPEEATARMRARWQIYGKWLKKPYL